MTAYRLSTLYSIEWNSDGEVGRKIGRKVEESCRGFYSGMVFNKCGLTRIKYGKLLKFDKLMETGTYRKRSFLSVALKSKNYMNTCSSTLFKPTALVRPTDKHIRTKGAGYSRLFMSFNVILLGTNSKA
jgi:hypothetical protein